MRPQRGFLRGRVWPDTAGRAFLRIVPLREHPALARWHGGAGDAGVISWALQNPGFIAERNDRAAKLLAPRTRRAVSGSLRVTVRGK